MTNIENLTLWTSVLSLIVAFISLVRTRIIADRQFEIEAELAKRQIEQMDDEAKEKSLPKLIVSLTKLGKTNHFIVANRGESSAFNLMFELVDCEDSPLTPQEHQDIFPYTELRSNQRVRLHAAIHLNSPIKYTVRLSYSDKNDNFHSEDHYVSR